MEIEVNFEDFAQVHNGLELARSYLNGARLALEELTSKSATMTEFVAEAKRVDKLVKKYHDLVAKDSLSLLEVSASFENVDKAQAAVYAKGIYASQGVEPSEGEPYYKDVVSRSCPYESGVQYDRDGAAYRSVFDNPYTSAPTPKAKK